MPIFNWCTFSLILLSYSGFCQDATVLGMAKSWAGKEIRLIKESDPIARIDSTLSIDTIATDGSFSLSANVPGAGQYWISVKRFKAPIFLSAGESYNIELIDRKENVLVDTWQNGRFDYALMSPDSLEINAVISGFDADYYDFYVKNASLLGSSDMRNKVKEFEAAQGADSTSFAGRYKLYSIAEMKLEAGFELEKIFEEYIGQQPVAIENPAYFNFFDKFYADYFQVYDLKFKGPTLYNRLKKGMNADSLFMLLNADRHLKNDTIKQLVVLKSIAENTTNKQYSRDALKRLLTYIIGNPANAEVLQIAKNLLRKTYDSAIGKNWLADFSGMLRQVSGQTPKADPTNLPTLVFVASGNLESLKETALLMDLQKKYLDIFSIVEVNIDRTEKADTASWPTFTTAKTFDFLNALDIYGIPHFIWLDANGNISENGIEKPSLGLESRLFKIKSEKEQDNKIKVGQ